MIKVRKSAMFSGILGDRRPSSQGNDAEGERYQVAVDAILEMVAADDKSVVG
jgi:hypothetical protein